MDGGHSHASRRHSLKTHGSVLVLLLRDLPPTPRQILQTGGARSRGGWIDETAGKETVRRGGGCRRGTHAPPLLGLQTDQPSAPALDTYHSTRTTS
jgi:hypothetical protein